MAKLLNAYKPIEDKMSQDTSHVGRNNGSGNLNINGRVITPNKSTQIRRQQSNLGRKKERERRGYMLGKNICILVLMMW